jgi:hypothetical protein
MFETLSHFSISRLIVAAVVVVAVYVITFAVVFGTFVFLARRRLPLLRSRFNPSHLRVRLWQFMAAIVVFGLSLELVILAETSFRAIRKAEDHAGRQRGTGFFWASSTSSGRPGDRSDAWVTDYYRELGRYHQHLSSLSKSALSKRLTYEPIATPMRRKGNEIPVPDLLRRKGPECAFG